MNETEINWTDLTWNFFSGCEEITPGCAFCYAKSLAEQRRGTPAFPVGFDPVFKPHKLREPLKVKEPSLIFVNSMSDFHLRFWPEHIPAGVKVGGRTVQKPGTQREVFTDDMRDQGVAIMREAKWHRFQLLTKRIDDAVRYWSTREVPPNVWLGVTVENVKHGLPRIAELRKLRDRGARVLFLSCEPLLEDLGADLDLSGIDWVIGGGESGKHLVDEKLWKRRAMVRRGARGESTWVPREDRYHWATNLRDACARAGAAFWFKQWGGTFPKAGGREIEGVEHDGMPEHIAGAMPDGRGATQRRKSRQTSLPVVP